MDSKKVLEELENKYEELAKAYRDAQEEITLFEEEAEFAEYQSKTEAERKTEFPKRYTMYEKQAALSQKLDELEQEILQSAQNLQRDIDVAIGNFKERIEQNVRARDELEQETVELRAQLKELKKTPEYKSGEQEAIERAEDLQVRLKQFATEKGKLTKSIKMFQLEINRLEETKAELVAEYGEQVVEAVAEEVVEAQEQEENQDAEQRGVETSNQEAVEEVKPQVDEQDAQETEEHKKIKLQILNFENELEECVVEYHEAMKKVTELNLEIMSLKTTEEYQKGDAATLAKVETMEQDLVKKVVAKNKIAQKLKDIRGKINQLEAGQMIVDEQQIEQETEEQNQILSLEKDLEECAAEYHKAMKEIRELDQEIMELKATEEYKKGDEATLAKVETMEQELAKKVVAKNKIAQKLREIRGRINQLKSGQTIGSEHQRGQEQEEQPAINAFSEKPQVERGTRRTRNQNTQNVHNITVTDTTSQVNNEPETHEAETKYSKKDFDELCAKAKKGKLTQEEFDKLAEIMQDEQSYDRLGITTGVIFNKSKTILKAMAEIATSTGKTARLSRERLGLVAEQANEENGYLSTSSLKEWKGLKTLMGNLDRKIASEELFKKVVELDRDSLTDEQKEVWDSSAEHLRRFGQLRGCLQTCQSVSERRREKSRWWTPKASTQSLPEVQTNTPPASSFSSNLESMVKEAPDDSEIKLRGNSVKEPIK